MPTFLGLVAVALALAKVAAPITPASLDALHFVLAAMLAGTAAAQRQGRSPIVDGVRTLHGAGRAFDLPLRTDEGLKSAAPVIRSSVFMATPLMAAGFGRLHTRQPSTPNVEVALATGAVGRGLRDDPAALPRIEIGSGWTACAARALYAAMMRRLSRGEPALALMSWANLAGMALLLVGGAPHWRKSTGRCGPEWSGSSSPALRWR